MNNEFIIREINDGDYFKNFMNIINYFTREPILITFEEFKERIYNIKKQNSIILVIEFNNIIIGTAKIFIEYKMHNNFKNIGHLEDVIIDEKYRNKGLGMKLIQELIKIAKDNNCYKIILNCNEDNKKAINLYLKNNFVIKTIGMVLYF